MTFKYITYDEWLMTKPFKEQISYHGAPIEYLHQDKDTNESVKVCLVRIPDCWQRGIDYDI